MFSKAAAKKDPVKENPFSLFSKGQSQVPKKEGAKEGEKEAKKEEEKEAKVKSIFSFVKPKKEEEGAKEAVSKGGVASIFKK